MKRYLIIIVTALLCSGEVLFGQGVQIKRHVIATLGLPHVSYGTSPISCTAITLGQPPNAGTITENGLCLRQGYQQPVQDQCNIDISFDVKEDNQQDCGTFYVFEYTGDLDPGTSVSWQFGANASPMIFDGPLSPGIGFSTTGPQEVVVTVSNGACQKSVMQFVDATGTPFQASFTKVDAWCYGDKGSIDMTAASSNMPLSYQWSNGAKTEDLDNLNPGKYAYTVTDSKGCTRTGEVEIEGSTQPLIIQTKVLDELCKDTKDGSIEITIQNAAQPVNFTWDDGGTGMNRDSLTMGTYGVKIEDAFGCQLDTSFNVRTFCDLNEEDFIPDVFSPNNDNFNDTWNILMLDRFPEHSVKVFNRWGNIIWEANGNFAGWDGKNSGGDDMPMGAYFYVIELNDDTKKVFKGSVTLIR